MNDASFSDTEGMPSFIMALHSSSETFGIAVLNLQNPKESKRSSTFQIGKLLSNTLLSCVEELLPAKYWPQLIRLAVNTGPGKFTSTRLTIVMARTLAQELNCPLDGISSFALMAPRLAKSLSKTQINKPFWVIQELHRRGIVAGKYLIKNKTNINCTHEALELETPSLIKSSLNLEPAIQAEEVVDLDVIQLLNLSYLYHQKGVKSNWSDVLPIYPTSPVGNIK